MSIINAYVAVHGGAGVHGEALEKNIKHALRAACTRALSLVSTEEGSALSMAEAATSVLEDEPRLNAGYGSNLTIDGAVECDAAIMAAQCNLFGSVGAVSGVKNPIKLACSILDYSRVPDRLGRIPPLTLVSEGAAAFAKSRMLEIVSPEVLIAPGAKDRWKKWKDRYEAPSNGNSNNRLSELRNIQDTVGAIAWHPHEGMAAGVSSGGLLLKHPGRIGEASVYGAGCWAQQQSPSLQGIACSVSGTGEHIVRSMLAREIGEKVIHAMSQDKNNTHEIIQDTLANKFWEAFREKGEISPSAGIILLSREVSEEEGVSVRLWCAFTTPSMSIAYASPRHPKPKAIILRHPDASGMRDGKPRIFITAITL